MKIWRALTNKYFLYVLGGLLSAALLVFIFLHSKDAFIKIWSEVNINYLFLAAAASAAIYVFMGLSLWEVLRVMDKKINLISAVAIALVSTTVNYIVSSLGVSGFALRAHLLGRRKVPLGVSVTASIVLTVIIYMVLALIILQGSILMIFTSAPSKEEIFRTAVLIMCMGGVCAAIILFLFHNDLRITWVRKGFRVINRILYKLFSLIIPKARFDIFSSQLEGGINFIQQKKGRLTLAVVYVCADWLFTILILYFAFRAVGVLIPPGLLVAGFAVGMATTLIPVLPGGIGAMEIAMTAVFTSNSAVSWESALTACLIYRFMYYIFPGLISIVVYWILKFSERRHEHHRQEAAQ